jgi:hypothetical protein
MSQSPAVRDIFVRWWPRLGAATFEMPSQDQRGDFLTAMRGCQADLIRHYLPAMAPDRVPWARRTLQELER